MMFVIQNKVMSDFDGYNSLISLYYAISQNSENEIILDFKNCTKFEANLSAILGAICSISEEREAECGKQRMPVIPGLTFPMVISEVPSDPLP